MTILRVHQLLNSKPSHSSLHPTEIAKFAVPNDHHGKSNSWRESVQPSPAPAADRNQHPPPGGAVLPCPRPGLDSVS